VARPPGQAEPVERVSTLELFFDLVFVFTITQLTAVLSDDPTPRRLLLVGGMAGFLVLALAIPRAFTEGDAAFGVAYLVVVGIHAGLFTRAGATHTLRAVIRLAPFNLGSALLVLAAVLVQGPAAYLLWAAAFACEWVTPLLAGTGGFRIAPAHFVERHGLVVIVALGESIVAIGIGAAGLPVDLGLASVAVLGLLLAACLWWAYFGGDDTRAERALAAVPDHRRGWVAIQSFGYCHLAILLGIIALAAGLKDAIGHAFDPLDLPHALLLAGGTALFLVGDALFRHTLRLGPARPRAAAALLCLATIPLGLAVSALAQLTTLVLVLAATFTLERRVAGAPDRQPRR
jgi:low temperature requirement protein LtrA